MDNLELIIIHCFVKLLIINLGKLHNLDDNTITIIETLLDIVMFKIVETYKSEK